MVSNSGITFSGLGSGLDTNAIVRQLVAIERLPIQSLQSRRGTEQRRLDLVGQLGDLVKTLQSRADDLSSPEKFFAYTASISDESVAAITTNSLAEEGSHTLDVQRLAAVDRWAFDAVGTRDVNLTAEEGEQISFKVGSTVRSASMQGFQQGRLVELAQILRGRWAHGAARRRAQRRPRRLGRCTF